ncbi:MAG: hypothetical protein Q7T40_09970 [Methylobacter sp.]|nr:hypothetical protein [Methylobacter sp.]
MRFQHQLRRPNETGDLNPKLPSTPQGELRDYQVEGYQWMVRLADDMGLGKTVQPLALILAPTLNTASNSTAATGRRCWMRQGLSI